MSRGPTTAEHAFDGLRNPNDSIPNFSEQSQGHNLASLRKGCWELQANLAHTRNREPSTRAVSPCISMLGADAGSLLRSRPLPAQGVLPVCVGSRSITLPEALNIVAETMVGETGANQKMGAKYSPNCSKACSKKRLLMFGPIEPQATSYDALRPPWHLREASGDDIGGLASLQSCWIDQQTPLGKKGYQAPTTSTPDSTFNVRATLALLKDSSKNGASLSVGAKLGEGPRP